ncbi:FAD-dependent oxidoreductase [Aldersonia sp. NBC_00410]|uniref:NAD(P)/FAD-dependent oxidoreductase n=1 Tax=Aldersonia sp. NBC_00410 TaxID=2975954 RepID=UPI00224D6DE3|nr:FAD-dependent oxidoreductase [Aldersonia sp. NBC_00410]MCX5042803.1 FAD-dependent oxidoreductase [Aldersonia sp. NBC_00410]
MSAASTFVIVGGGLAAAKLAQALRDKDFPGDVIVIAAEEHLPYERPPLSKDYLADKQTLADATPLPAQWYRDHHIDLRLGTTVTALDPAAHTVTLPDGSTIGYTKLALATGSRPRIPDLPGADAAGVHYLRTVDDADTLLAMLGASTRLAIVGAGWIGLEVAAAARNRDVAVTVVESARLPLLGALGPEMGEVFAALHREHGVDLRFESQVAEITTTDGRATGLRLGDGSTVESDAVLVAVGAAPNVELAREAGLDVDGGVLVDENLQTSDSDIVAVGDIAAQQHPVLGRRIRVEHWANALNQPATAAATMLGHPRPYENLPYFFTDQYDLGMEYVGYATGDARVVVRGDTGAREFVAFWLDGDNRVLAGMNVNVWDVTDTVKEMITAGRPVDPTRLTDSSVPLDSV